MSFRYNWWELCKLCKLCKLSKIIINASKTFFASMKTPPSSPLYENQFQFHSKNKPCNDSLLTKFISYGKPY